MVASLEALADLLDIPDAVVGVTVSAAGTSLPNYVASKVAAENGFGVRLSIARTFPRFFNLCSLIHFYWRYPNRTWLSRMHSEAIHSTCKFGLSTHTLLK